MAGRPEPPKPPETPARRFTDVLDPNSTVIGPGTRIKGDLTAEGPVDVGGAIEGDVKVGAHCRVRPGARVIGRLEAKTLVVEGEVRGETLVADKVEIGSAAQVQANVRARLVAIADGAAFEGAVQMDTAGDGAPQSFTEKRAGR
jgi:cytoskeletal protein CcmA (bactofilin family)